MSIISDIAKQAAKAARTLIKLSAEQKATVLKEMASELRAKQALIVEVNKQDLEQARQNQLSDAMIDRLTLDEARINDMATGLEIVAELPAVVGKE